MDGSLHAAFTRWYAVYPRKVGKAAAAKAFPMALAIIASQRCDALDWLIEVTRVYAASPAGQAGTYTPHPATWLNQARYDDDPAEWQRRSGSDDPRGNLALAQRLLEGMSHD